MTPREYAATVLGVPGVMVLESYHDRAIEAIARVIREAVAEERESCAIVADQAREAIETDGGRATAVLIARVIRLRAGRRS